MNEDKQTYIGLTIGPIIETISNSKQTGELWGSSYVFSYIMKNIIKNLLEKKVDLENKFILPCIDNLLKEGSSNKEIGLFHDRFIFESGEGDFKLVENAIDEVLYNIADSLKKIKCEKNIEEIKANIKDFLKIYFLEIEIKSKDENIIEKVNKALDALELREKISTEQENYLIDSLKNVQLNNSKEHFLCKDAYGDDGKKGSYPSLFKIALGRTEEHDFPNEDNEIRKKINNIKKVNEYVAIVQADGDSMGSLIKTFKVYSDDGDKYKDYKKFSKALLEYDSEAHEKIKEYKGFTVYAGGDDLLFIAPVIFGENNIFKLINELSEIFNDKFDEENRPSLSFGVAIVHNKFPLYYALEESRNLLFEHAKKYKFKEKEKNAVAFRVIKSSGQSFGAVVGKQLNSYKGFINLLDKILNDEGKEEINEKILNSIHFKLKKDEVILNEIGRDMDLLKNYFDNNFNEKVHLQEPIKTYIKDLREFTNEIYKDEDSSENIRKDLVKGIDQLYAYLRFIKFISEEGR